MKLVRESLNEDLSFFATAAAAAVGMLGAIAVYKLPKIINRIGEISYAVADAYRSAVDIRQLKREENNRNSLVKETLETLQQDPEFIRLVKNILANPYSGTEDMYLKGKSKGYGEPLSRLKKTRVDDYKSMQKNRKSALNEFKKYLTEVLDEEQMTVFSELVKQSTRV